MARRYATPTAEQFKAAAASRRKGIRQTMISQANRLS
jgi:hypothetical protein